MGRTLAAGTAVVFFVGAVIALGANADRIAAFAALVGLAAMSIAVLLHVSDPRVR